MIYTPPVDNVVCNHLLMDFTKTATFCQKLHQQRSLTPIKIRRGFWEFRVRRIPSPDFQWDAIRQRGSSSAFLAASRRCLSASLAWKAGFTAAVGVWNVPTRKNAWFLIGRKIFERNSFLCSCKPQSMPIFKGNMSQLPHGVFQHASAMINQPLPVGRKNGTQRRTVSSSFLILSFGN